MREGSGQRLQAREQKAGCKSFSGSVLARGCPRLYGPNGGDRQSVTPCAVDLSFETYLENNHGGGIELATSY